MRTSLALTRAALFAAVVAGCSSLTPGTKTLPDSGSAAPVAPSRAAFETELEHAGHDAKAVAIWASNAFFNYLVGMDETGSIAVDSIDVGANGCLGPNSVKIDSSRNIWVACFTNQSGETSGSLEQEYSSGGSLLRSFKWTTPCPQTATICGAFSNDGGPDRSGHVFSEMNGSYLQNNKPYMMEDGFFWWPADRPNAAPKFIGLGTSCSPICQPLNMDTDKSGNIWFTFQGSGHPCCSGLGEVTNPTTKPRVLVVLAPGTYKFGRGVFTSDGGATLNVVDSGVRKIYQYRLPLTPASKPFNTLGPTATGLSAALGQPNTGGFNRAETKIAIGDYGGWVNLGTVASNRWTAKLSMQLLPQPVSAAYTPSDR